MHTEGGSAGQPHNQRSEQAARGAATKGPARRHRPPAHGLSRAAVQQAKGQQKTGYRRRRLDAETGSDAALRRFVAVMLPGMPWNAVAVKVTSPVRWSVSRQAVGSGTWPARWALQAGRQDARVGFTWLSLPQCR